MQTRVCLNNRCLVKKIIYGIWFHLFLCFGNALYVILKSVSLVAGKSVEDVVLGYVKTVHIWQDTQKGARHVVNITLRRKLNAYLKNPYRYVLHDIT